MSIGVAPPHGWGGPLPDQFIAKNGTGAALARGTLLILDILNNSSDATNNKTSDPNSGLYIASPALPAQGNSGIYVVTLAACAIGADVQVMLRGEIKNALVGRVLGTTALAIGDNLTVSTGTKTYLEGGTPVTGNKVIGRLKNVTATLVADTPVEAEILFDGYSGFGIE